MKRCLFCYQQLLQDEVDFHPKCSKKIFGQPLSPEVPFSESDAENLALEIIRTQMTVTGVQPKLSLELDRKPSAARPARFTIVGLWGSFILKPPTLFYPQLPEVEDLALTLNGKKKKINREDFTIAFTASRLDVKQQQNIFSKMQKAIPKWLDFIDLSFLSEDFKTQYKALILERKRRLGL